MEQVLDKIKDGSLPDHLKQALVQGLLPLDPSDMMLAVFLLCSKENQYLEMAKETIVSLPEGSKLEYLGKPERDPEILEFFLRYFNNPDAVISCLLLNPNIAAKTLRAAAPKLPTRFLQFVVNNQVKILEDPLIIQALRQNKGLSINEQQKLADYERLFINNRVESKEALENKDLKQVEEEAIAQSKKFVEVFGKEKVTRKDLISKSKEQESEQEQDQEAEPPEANASLVKMMSTMNIPQKIQMAIKGNREARSILIREANKLVCSAVVKSPKITDAEVEFYSNLRNVQSDVLRLIAMNREWVRNYQIVHNLVRNPRTPLDVATKFVIRLNKMDLQLLQRDRGVSELIRKMAHKIIREKK